MARQICQHIIGMNPSRIGDWSTVKLGDDDEDAAAERADAPPTAVEKSSSPSADPEKSEEELEMDRETADAMRKTVDREELVHQEFLVDPNVTVGRVLMEIGIRVKEFVRLEVGQNREE